MNSEKNMQILRIKIIFTGMIDEYFEYQLGALEYRSVRFETEVLDWIIIREMLW